MSLSRRSERAVLVCAALTMVLGACAEATQQNAGGKAEPTVNAVEVTASEYAFDIPAEVEGGVVSLELSNEGAEHHEFGFAKLADGASIEDALKAMQQGKEPEGMEDLAGVPLLSPDQQVTMTRALEPGTYVFLCAFPTPDFTPHAAKGMYKTFEVTGDAGATEPEPDATIVATDDGFELPDLQAGTHTIKFRNDGSKPHEFLIFGALKPDATDKDFEKWIGQGQEGDAPLIFPGGLQSIEPGASVVQTLTLQEDMTYTVQDFENQLTAELAVP